MALLLPPITGQAAGLFTPVTGTPPSSLPSGDLTLRSRVVTMDLAQIQRARIATTSSGQPRYTMDAAAATRSAGTVATPGTALTFNLFDDVVVTGRVEHTAPTYSGGYSVSGHLVEERLGTMMLVVNGKTVAGTVRRLGGTYHIRSVSEGLYVVSEVEESPLGCAAEALHSEAGHRH